MTDEIMTVNCPICGKSVVWGEQSPYRPFCCKRCQLIDLGEWADEEKRIRAILISQKAMIGVKNSNKRIAGSSYR